LGPAQYFERVVCSRPPLDLWCKVCDQDFVAVEVLESRGHEHPLGVGGGVKFK
jgi:hypothetical protein